VVLIRAGLTGFGAAGGVPVAGVDAAGSAGSYGSVGRSFMACELLLA
jgi:hypothetical protein